MADFRFSESEAGLIVNGLVIAAERYESNAAEFRKVAKTGGQGFITATGAVQLAETFEAQASETRELIDHIQETLYGPEED